MLDKTGTLTYGRPTVTDVETFGITRADLLAIAGAVESPSEHPLGQAIGFFAQREGAVKKAAANFRAVPGKGVSALVDGAEVIAGKPSFIEERGVWFSDEVRARIEAFAAQGKTVVIVARDGQAIGALALQDTPRRGADRLMEKLRRHNIKTVMLTGDARRVAEAIGAQLGVDEVRAELMPTEKISAIEDLQRDGRKVAMVGDGINDAPALVQANVGIAVGAGTDVAIESAGVILVGDRIDDVFSAIILGRAITPVLAIGFMVLSIFAILLNTLRIRAINLQHEELTESGPLAEADFLVPNMVCEGCAQKITVALSSVPGVQQVHPKVSQKHIYVRYEPGQSAGAAVAISRGQSGLHRRGVNPEHHPNL